MKAEQIRELSVEEISKKLRDSRQELLDLKLRQQQGQLEKTHEIKLLRRDVARCETVLAQKAAPAE